MVELLSIKDLPTELKIKLLKELNYDSDGIFVIKNGEKFLDRYTEEPIRLDNMIILPGKSPPIVLDNNALSISSYLEEFGDVI